MKRSTLLILLLINLSCFSQQQYKSLSLPDIPDITHNNPVIWSAYLKQVSPYCYLLSVEASMLPGWHIYSEKQPPGVICQPTTIEVREDSIKHLGIDSLSSCCTFQEKGKLHIQRIKELNIRQLYYEDTVTFERIVKKINKEEAAYIKVSVTYQACNNTTCLPIETAYFYLKLK